MKRVFIIHGWGGDSNEGWLVWLKKELESKGYEVVVPDMPDTDNPKINAWTNHLKDLVGMCDKDTYFVSHSIGCQTVMRYLEKLSENEKAGGVIFVAGWFSLTEDTWDDDIYTKEKVDEWINTPINFGEIKTHTDRFMLIASDNDPYVSLSNTKLFKNNLGAKIIVLKQKGHISGEDGVTELPIVLEELLKMTEV